MRLACCAAHIQSLTNGCDPAGNITAITGALASSRSQTLDYDSVRANLRVSWEYRLLIH